jgi:hypothetical protein
MPLDARPQDTGEDDGDAGEGEDCPTVAADELCELPQVGHILKVANLEYVVNFE